MDQREENLRRSGLVRERELKRGNIFMVYGSRYKVCSFTDGKINYRAMYTDSDEVSGDFYHMGDNSKEWVKLIK